VTDLELDKPVLRFSITTVRKVVQMDESRVNTVEKPLIEMVPIERGRTLLATVFVIYLLIDSITAIGQAYTSGRAVPQLARLLIDATLLYFTYTGHRWARALLVFFCIISLVIAGFFIPVLARTNAMWNLLLIVALTVLAGWMLWLLTNAASVRAFLEMQRQKARR
jgi:hypothetical protein